MTDLEAKRRPSGEAESRSSSNVRSKLIALAGAVALLIGGALTLQSDERQSGLDRREQRLDRREKQQQERGQFLEKVEDAIRQRLLELRQREAEIQRRERALERLKI